MRGKQGLEESIMQKPRATPLIALTLTAGLFLLASTARADGWPGSVAGNWEVTGNLSTGTLTIVQYPGATGSMNRPIRGTIYRTDNIEGYYCPFSGRIVFIRFDKATTSPKQYWSGNVSQLNPKLKVLMGGTMSVFRHDTVKGTVGGGLGEYNFSAKKK